MKSTSIAKTFIAATMLLVASLLASVLSPVPVSATSGLTIDVITWDLMGLDSNDVTTGPDTFPIGVKVCNTTGGTVADVAADLTWETANSYIATDGPASFSIGSLAASACDYAYFSVKITRDTAAWFTSRDYNVTATATGGYTVSTQNRQVYVEKLVSQNRNTIDKIAGAGGCDATFTTCDPAPTAVSVGSTYTYKLYGSTSTDYEQLEATISFPGSIFKVLSVSAAFENPSSYVGISPYGDACAWIDDKTDINFNDCGAGNPDFASNAYKVGGDTVTTYIVEVIGTGSANLDGLFYDFSGSSFHYNSDFGSGTYRIAVTATSPGSSPTPTGSAEASASPEASGDGGGLPSTTTSGQGDIKAFTLAVFALWLALFGLLLRERKSKATSAHLKR